MTPTTTPCTCTWSASLKIGLHRRVRGLEPNLAAGLAIELLERDLRAAEQRDHHLAVVGVLRSSTTTKSPSRICSSIIESPRTRST
jgi:hypothetical protein